MTENPVFDDDIMITMRAVADSVGLPYTVNPVELVDREAVIELREGPAGPPGPEGDRAWPWDWQGDIADVDALRALDLTTADARKAWRVVSDNAVYYWTGLEFIAFGNAFGKRGHRGPVTRMTGAGVAGPTGSAASAQIVGDAPEQHLEITFPRGEIGDPGEPGGIGRIQDSADVLVDADHFLGQNFVLSWDAASQKFTPAPSPRLMGPWAIGQGQFNGGSNLDDAHRVLASITIPAQPMAWQPVVEGIVGVASKPTDQSTACHIEVRLGDPKEGDLVGLGVGSPATTFPVAMVAPAFAQPTSPEQPLAVVPANRTVTLYVIVRRAYGTGRYTVGSHGAQIIVYARPV
ncbi:hypothetical protein [Nocardia sp. AG03]|uniref:hypothetical protein n=1 Tax=Nocardia sp. AG03 TaxID=3025312 RepID=UPI002418520D|nr:hypothetical protein [Nocardia sp. AG03]